MIIPEYGKLPAPRLDGAERERERGLQQAVYGLSDKLQLYPPISFSLPSPAWNRA